MAATPPNKTATKAKAKAKAPAKGTTKARASRRRAPTQEAIAKRAYELSLGDREGDDVSHWLQAERELSRA